MEGHIELLPAKQVFHSCYALLIASSLAIDLRANASVIPLTVTVLGSTRSVTVEERDILGAAFLWILHRLNRDGHLCSGWHDEVRGRDNCKHPGRRQDLRNDRCYRSEAWHPVIASSSLSRQFEHAGWDVASLGRPGSGLALCFSKLRSFAIGRECMAKRPFRVGR